MLKVAFLIFSFWVLIAICLFEAYYIAVQRNNGQLQPKQSGLVLQCNANGSVGTYVKPIYRGTDSELFQQISAIVECSTRGAFAGTGYKWLAKIEDTFGNRHLGSDRLEKAIDYIATQAAEKDGFSNVQKQKVGGLINWKRGMGEATLLTPRPMWIGVLATGSSPPGNVTADAVVVASFDELNARTDVKGKIVVFNEEWKGYSITNAYRHGATQAAAAGAVGVLIRSVTSFSLYTLHTGVGDDAGIPSACITVEDAQTLHRMQKRGEKLRIHLELTSHLDKPTVSRNLLFEMTGDVRPKEVVLLSCHIDSWDTGQGALDDGAGCAVMWQAMKTIQHLGLRPARTIRMGFWTAEEVGGYMGSHAYHAANKGTGDGVSSERFVFVSESDMGAFRPSSCASKMRTFGTVKQRKFVQDILSMLNLKGIPIAVESVDAESIGEVRLWSNASAIPGTYYYNYDILDRYFQFHHSPADRMTSFDPFDIDDTAAVYAAIAFAIAERGIPDRQEKRA